MLCPDDRSPLAEDRPGVSSCRRCRGHAVSGEAFVAVHEDVAQLLRAERDRGSGAYARVRACPRCGRPMQPLRMGDLPAWLDSCASCQLLWVEKLDEAVVRRLERRRALARTMEEMGPVRRREMANDIVRELEDDQRRLDVLEAIRALLWDAAGCVPPEPRR